MLPAAYAQVTLNNVTLYTDSANYTIPDGEPITLNKLNVMSDGIQMRKIAWEEFRIIDFNRTGTSDTYVIHLQQVEQTHWQFNVTSTVTDAFARLVSSMPREIQLDGTEVDINFTSFETFIDVGANRTVRIIYLPSAITPTPLANVTFPSVAINQTNPEIVDFFFERTDIDANTVQLNITYPEHYDTAVTFRYNLAQTEDTYTNLSTVDVEDGRVEASFTLNNPERDVIDVRAVDLNTNHTGNYVLTITDFHLLGLIEDFRAGDFGTLGMFGAVDFITLGVMIMAMIGFNRVNETAGVLVAVMIVGATAWFGIIQLPAIIFGAIIVVVMLAIVTTRRIG